MKILYGVAGEGLGHSSRAKEMISHLIKRGHEVLVMTYGQAYPVLSKLYNTVKIKGIHLRFKKHELSLIDTALSSLSAVKENIKKAKVRDREILRFAPDVAITDFEPVTALFAYKYSLPLISIDNQHRLTHLKLSVPRKYLKSYLIAKTATALNPPKADAYIITSFAKLPSISEKAHIVSPIIRKAIKDLKTSKKDFILVYQTKPNKELIKILKRIPERFTAYGYGEKKSDKNITYKPLGDHFLKDLSSCKAIIATSGFTLISEALYLKKPYFALPLKGQFEQILNALFLKESGFGDFSDSPSEKEMRNFTNSLTSYEKRLKRYRSRPDEAFFVLDKVLKKIS